MKVNLKQLSEKELGLFIEKLGQKPYRTRQIINWIYMGFAIFFDEMTDLSLSFRKSLNEAAYISSLKIVKTQKSKDGTQKFLFELEDANTIESVLIPDKSRLTLCVSSQMGCAMGCRFCMTGKLGFKRNLKAYEIVDQVIAINRFITQKLITKSRPDLKSPHPPNSPLTKGGYRGVKGGITNIVFMGMGEPLDNFDEVIEALWRLTGFMGFSKRKITVSTAGIVPRISELSEKGPDINLAVSLNAVTDEVRNKIMPINKKYPLKELIYACKKFPLAPRRRITFEYVLLSDINDSKEDAMRLTKLLKGIRSKVNLIPYNPIYNPLTPLIPPLLKGDTEGLKRGKGGSGFKKPEDEKILSFQKILIDAGITAIIRKSKGQDIMAACGQLKANYLLK
ncbi:MAG: 23S rRNA (adenine(2503)-C(2))-methyltransferase RlmN [Nitrospirae bacterium]|nr:23S rRNA (adenine(2503)-C(2))-methyltransferase RlmN [Nitrospirota bacterium]